MTHQNPKAVYACVKYLLTSIVSDSIMILLKKVHLHENKEHYLILDEIQFKPRFEEVLNSLLRIKNLDVYVTGSNSRFLSSDIVTEFRGRGDELRVYPLSFSEFYSVYEGDFEDAWNEYMTYGGLPQIAGFQTERQKAEYLKNIFTNLISKKKSIG